MVPRTTTYREYKRKKAANESSKGTRNLQAGQTQLDSKRPGSNPFTEQIITLDDDEDQEMDQDSDRINLTEPKSEASKASGDIVFQHYEPNGRTHARPESEDVEMT